jgi:hypothetical protein
MVGITQKFVQSAPGTTQWVAREQADLAHEQASIWPESKRPAWVQKLEQPTPLTRASRLFCLIFEKPNLALSAEFLCDFGMTIAQHSKTELIMRGIGSDPAIYIARQGDKARYLGCVFSTDDVSDLDVLRLQAQAQTSCIAQRWGAQGVKMHDPAGFEVHVIHGIQAVEPLPLSPLIQPQGPNKPHQTTRLNAALRPPLLPAQVLHCSHVVLQVMDFHAGAQWYMRTLGLIPSDVQVLPDGKPNLVFMRLDRGKSPADHHTVVIAGGIENKYMHSAYEVADLDAIGQGHQYLRAKNWRPAWGIGRHYIGSQLFDYWFDPDGHEMEHMADSDRFDDQHETGYSNFDRKSLWMWGQDLPVHMAPPKNPLILVKIFYRILTGQLDGRKVKQIIKAMSTPPRSWIP